MIDLLTIAAFNARYTHTIDSDALEAWPAFFTEDCHYRITSEADVSPTPTNAKATTTNTTVNVFTPPQRSEIQPPATRTTAPINAASMVSCPA